MTVSGMKGGRKYGRLTWHIGAVFSWGAAAEFGLIWAVTGIGITVELWLAVVQLVAISGMALGALFLAAHQISDGGHGKKSRVSLAVFMLFLFGVLPTWAWMLPDDGAAVYIYWKIMGLGLVASFVIMLTAVVVKKYAAGRKDIGNFFQQVNKINNRIPSWAKYGGGGISMLIGILRAPTDLVDLTLLATIGLVLISDLIKIRLFNIRMDFFRKNRHSSETTKIADGSMTHAHLLEALQNISTTFDKIAAELKNLTAVVERMNMEPDKTDVK